MNEKSRMLDAENRAVILSFRRVSEGKKKSQTEKVERRLLSNSRLDTLHIYVRV